MSWPGAMVPSMGRPRASRAWSHARHHEGDNWGQKWQVEAASAANGCLGVLHSRVYPSCVSGVVWEVDVEADGSGEVARTSAAENAEKDGASCDAVSGVWGGRGDLFHVLDHRDWQDWCSFD